MSATIKYKILLDNDCEVFEFENILSKIPMIKQLIENNNMNDQITDKYIIDFKAIDPNTFGHVMTLVKYNASNMENDCNMFNTNFIKNMNTATLIDFISLSNYLGLDKYKQLAINKFMIIFNKSNLHDIRKEFQLKDDLTEEEKKNINLENEWVEEFK